MFSYAAYELSRTLIQPYRDFYANIAKQQHEASPVWPQHPLHSYFGKDNFWARSTSASLEMIERLTRDYKKPSFDIESTVIGDQQVAVSERIVASFPFCDLLHFQKNTDSPGKKLLIVAPMSGHFSSLLRDTVQRFLPECDVYITDWKDSREVPLSDGDFGLDDYVDYLIDICEILGGDTHVLGVCQPSVPVLVATAVMSARKSKAIPRSMILMGGPIDTRVSATKVTEFTDKHSLEWYEQNVIEVVPENYAGHGRRVCPGYLQLAGFVSMNLGDHLGAHVDLFTALVGDDAETAEKRSRFYDDYFAVQDISAQFYLDSIRSVFHKHELPLGNYRHRGNLVDVRAITDTALMTIEGSRDDITAPGQTRAAHGLCTGLDQAKHRHLLVEGAGHYGVFSGSRFRAKIAPEIIDFVNTHN